ncbi:P-loop containing nucleoside triphosphate hydrolase protein [Rhizoctonia solani]|uniref:P-loop containing nucleoside triphosphate hydrolase protein n=1 Tax=Rhizoctonia solani TaxID=456999 RepID=A0A8H7LZJ4_9AGAM|nr:P-loop containing nucleoside triphosphate hydrolase protein [Rhizoctonia solani]
MITPQLRPLAPLSGSMTYQHVLEDSGPTDSHSDDYQSLLYAPFISAILSAAVLLIHYYLHDLDLRRSLSSGTVRKKTRSTTRPTRAQRSINIWKVLRLGVCLILLLLAIVMLGMAESCPNPDNAKPGATDQVASALAGHGIGKRKKRQHHTNLCLTKEQSTRLSLACFYQTYTTLLAFLTLCLGPEFNAACDSHITPLLLLALLVDIWVQIFPGREMSKATLICDWVRIGFLAIASIITPILAWSSSPTNKYKTPPTNWPTSGGKDALALALLSGVGTHTIHPTILSSHISLITGQAASSSSRATVRYVLDPQHQYSNETLYAALNTAGLVGFGLEIGLKRISARAQYGVGFAAAVVRQSKLIIVDETTTSIEYAPDTEFHASLRCALPNATILVITNTLRNIQGVDKVLVLEAGHLAELGSPSELLNRHGAFRKLVDVDDARDALYVAFTD